MLEPVHKASPGSARALAGDADAEAQFVASCMGLVDWRPQQLGAHDLRRVKVSLAGLGASSSRRRAQPNLAPQNLLNFFAYLSAVRPWIPEGEAQEGDDEQEGEWDGTLDKVDKLSQALEAWTRG